MNIKIEKNLLKPSLVELLKTKKDFKLGELLKAEILREIDKFVLLNIEKKGIVKAQLQSPVHSKKLLLKVIDLSPSPTLKILKELREPILYDEIEHSLAFLSKNLKKIIKFIKKSNLELILNFSSNNIENKLKEYPSKLGITYEHDIIKNRVIENNLKKLAIENRENLYLDLIKCFHNLMNENAFIFPIFFIHSGEILNGIIGFKKKKLKPSKKDEFSILILLNLSLERILKIFISIIDKNLFINMVSNSEELIEILKNCKNKLIEKIKNRLDFNVSKIAFNIEQEFDNSLNILNFLENESIDIKA